MPCLNHPQVVTGLDSCTRCAKTFCIDCLVGRKSGWFCATCDKELGGAPSVAPSAGGSSEGKPAAPVAASKGKACKNHADVLGGLNPCAGCGDAFCPDSQWPCKAGLYDCSIRSVRDADSCFYLVFFE